MGTSSENGNSLLCIHTTRGLVKAILQADLDKAFWSYLCFSNEIYFPSQEQWGATLFQDNIIYRGEEKRDVLPTQYMKNQ